MVPVSPSVHAFSSNYDPKTPSKDVIWMSTRAASGPKLSRGHIICFR